MTGQRIEASPWAMSRRRAEALRDRYPFAEEMLGLYLALLDVWEEAWDWPAGRRNGSYRRSRR